MVPPDRLLLCGSEVGEIAEDGVSFALKMEERRDTVRWRRVGNVD